MQGKRSMRRALIAVVLMAGSAFVALAQDDAKHVQKRGIFVLDRLEFNLKKYYYDRKFHGLNLDQEVSDARENMKKVSTMGEMFLVASQFLLRLNDSHTFLYPPPRNEQPQYGFAAEMFGDKCIVTWVQPASDAERSGLRPGYEITSFGAIIPTRTNFFDLRRVLYVLTPVKTLQLRARDLEGRDLQLLVNVTFITRKEQARLFKKLKDDQSQDPFTCAAISSEVEVCKLRTFEVDKSRLGDLYKTWKGKKHVILDLRGNSGGLVETETDVLSHLFSHKILSATRTTNGKTERDFADGRSDAYTGELSVLVDSESASAAEVVARVVQIEKRGKVFGDVSSGAVRTSGILEFPIPAVPDADDGGGSIMFAFLSVTLADVEMSDGSKLEGVGVIPDEAITPSQYAISKGLDPILSIAATKAGGSITPEAAGALGFTRRETIEAAGSVVN